MAKTPSFTPILDRPSKAIEKPKPMPVGTYTGMVNGQPKFDKSTKKGTDYVEFTLKFIEPGDDVDQDDLVAALTKQDGETVPLNQKTTRVTFYLTEDATYRLVKFLDDCEAGDEDQTLSERIAEAPGKSVRFNIKHTASDDGQAIYANVDRTYRVTD